MNSKRNIYKALFDKIQGSENENNTNKNKGNDNESNIEMDHEHENTVSINEKITKSTMEYDNIDEKINTLLSQKWSTSTHKSINSYDHTRKHDTYKHFIHEKCHQNNDILLNTNLQLYITCFNIRFVKDTPYICYLLNNNVDSSFKHHKKQSYICHFPYITIKKDSFTNVYELLEYVENYITSLLSVSYSSPSSYTGIHNHGIHYHGILKIKNKHLQDLQEGDTIDNIKYSKINLVYEIVSSVNMNIPKTENMYWCNKFEITGDKMIYGKHKIHENVSKTLSSNEMFDLYDKRRNSIVQPITCYQLNNDDINKLNRNFNGKYGPYYYFISNTWVYHLRNQYKHGSRYHVLIGDVSDKPFITTDSEDIESWSDKFDSLLDEENIIVKDEQSIRWIDQFSNKNNES